MKTVEQNKFSIYNPRSLVGLADYAGKDLWKGEFWAWNEIVKRVMEVSGEEVESWQFWQKQVELSWYMGWTMKFQKFCRRCCLTLLIPITW